MLAAELATKCDNQVVLSHIAEVQRVLAERGLAFKDITGRNKNVAGVFKKMQKKAKRLEEVFDVRAIRVVVNHEVECYKVLDAIHSLWSPTISKDYIRSPKANGYQSLHTVVMLPDGCPLEIQIRTDRMDQVAEYGVAAHWRYKEDSASGANPFHERQVEWARFVLSWHSEVNDHKLRVNPGHAVHAHDDGPEVLACTFPEHRPDCKHKRLETEPVPTLALSKQDSDPVYVVVKRGGAVDIQMMPPRASLGSLRRTLAQVQPMDHLRMVVNHGACDEHASHAEEGERLLCMGDVVELVVEAPRVGSPGSSPSLIDISEDAIHRERVRLSQLWVASGSSPGSATASPSPGTEAAGAGAQPIYYYEAPKARPVRALRPATWRRSSGGAHSMPKTTTRPVMEALKPANEWS
eukprot:1793612-Pyramimonas_sp.AAC.2